MNASNRKFLLLACLCVAVSVCGAKAPKPGRSSTGKEVAPGVLQIGRINHPRLTESSGVAASRQYPGVFWTHNDGGGFKKQVLYGIRRDGKFVSEFRVEGALL